MSGARGAAPELDGFRHVEWLGGGGFADVFRYEQTVLGREVAVKVLHRGIGGSALESFRSEANLMAKLSNHPSIVSIYQAGVSGDGRPFLVMEMCPSKHLGARVASRTFTVQRALELGIQISGAVETAHGQGILHRDIKPANILFTQFGRPALTDFGISVSTDSANGGTGRALSPPWAPPEQFGNSPHPMGPWSDVYSLAATLWASLVGRSPMERPQGPNDALSLGARVRSEPAPRTGRQDVPESLERALSAALSKEPQQRYQTALEFARALQAIQAELHLSVTTVDVLADEIEEDYGSEETGTRVAGFQLIDPDAPPTAPTSFGGTARTSGQTEIVSRGSSIEMAAGGAPVLYHGRGSAPAVDPLEFTGPAPLTVDQGHTYVPEDFVEEGEVPQRRRWPIVLAVGLVVLALGAGGAFALNRLAGTAAAADPSASPSVAPADPVGQPVPRVENLAGERQGDEVTFTWTNPEPLEGDTYTYEVEMLGEDSGLEITEQPTVTVPAQDPKTCISVELRRSSGRSSTAQEVCVE